MQWSHSCRQPGDSSGHGIAEPELDTIWGVLGANGFGRLRTILELSGLDQAVDDPNVSWTLFAPSDNALGELEPDFLTYLTLNPSVLSFLLQYHVVAEVLTFSDLEAHPAPTVVTLTGQEILVECDGQDLTLQGFNDGPLNRTIVEWADLAASNGIVHGINNVLIPKLPSIGTTILQGYSLFNRAVQIAVLTNTLNSFTDDYTVLVPSNEAFRALGDDVLNAVFSDVNTLTTILATHVIPGPGLDRKAVSELTEIANTWSGIPLRVTTNGTDVFLAAPGNEGEGAKVQVADIEALPSSIIHVIDTVLLPQA